MRIEDIPGRSYIYVVGPDIGPKKIGIAKDFRKRLSQYKTHNTQNILDHFSMNCPKEKAVEIEKNVHIALRDRHSHGEWFDVTKDEAISAVLKEVMAFRHPHTHIVSYRTRHSSTDHFQINLYNWPKKDAYPTGLLVACIDKEGDTCELEIGPDTTNGKWELAPKRYRKNFTDLTECFRYAEDKIFNAVERDLTSRNKASRR